MPSSKSHSLEEVSLDFPPVGWEKQTPTPDPRMRGTSEVGVSDSIVQQWSNVIRVLLRATVENCSPYSNGKSRLCCGGRFNMKRYRYIPLETQQNRGFFVVSAQFHSRRRQKPRRLAKSGLFNFYGLLLMMISSILIVAVPIFRNVRKGRICVWFMQRLLHRTCFEFALNCFSLFVEPFAVKFGIYHGVTS